MGSNQLQGLQVASCQLPAAESECCKPQLKKARQRFGGLALAFGKQLARA